MKEDAQRQSIEGEYAVYVKVKLIVVAGENVDLDDAVCQDRLIEIKSGFAHLINKLPLDKFHIGKINEPTKVILTKNARSDTTTNSKKNVDTPEPTSDKNKTSDNNKTSDKNKIVK
jgi:hypothetical protein